MGNESKKQFDNNEYTSHEIQAIIRTTAAYTSQLEILNNNIKNFIDSTKDSIYKQNELSNQQEKSIKTLSDGFIQIAKNLEKVEDVIEELLEFHTNVYGGLAKKLKEIEEKMKEEIRENTNKLFLKITGLFAVITGIILAIQQFLK